MKRAYIAIPAALAFAAAPFELPIPVLPIAALIGVAPLAGCAGNVPGTTTNIADVVNAVIAGVKAGCQVVPAAADVASLITPYGGDVAAIVSAICKAVQAAPTISGKRMASGLRMGVAPVVVHGVVVHFN